MTTIELARLICLADEGIAAMLSNKPSLAKREVGFVAVGYINK